MHRNNVRWTKAKNIKERSIDMQQNKWDMKMVKAQWTKQLITDRRTWLSCKHIGKQIITCRRFWSKSQYFMNPCKE